MARPREFDEAAVLDKALNLFWRKGFERTSIQDLVEHTGVHRGSLYDTFGDKNQLFLLCLEQYRKVKLDQAINILEGPGEFREVLRQYFTRMIDILLNDENGRRGCFIANTAMDLGAVDPVISSRIEQYSQELEDMFIQILNRAEQQGQLHSEHSIPELARFLLSTRNGLYVLGKSVTDRKILEDAVKVALSIFQ